MKKVLLILAILLTLSLVALFVFQVFPMPGSGEAAPTGAQETTLPNASGDEEQEADPSAPSTTAPENDTQPVGTTVPETTPEESSIPTAAPGLDENETPPMEI